MTKITELAGRLCTANGRRAHAFCTPSLRTTSQSFSLIWFAFFRRDCGNFRACTSVLSQLQAAGMRLQSCAPWLLALTIVRNTVSAQGNRVTLHNVQTSLLRYTRAGTAVKAAQPRTACMQVQTGQP